MLPEIMVVDDDQTKTRNSKRMARGIRDRNLNRIVSQKEKDFSSTTFFDGFDFFLDIEMAIFDGGNAVCACLCLLVF